MKRGRGRQKIKEDKKSLNESIKMIAEIITTEDLQRFRIQLLNDLKTFVCELVKDKSETSIEGYKTKQVRQILGCCNNTLLTLRVSGKLRYRKVGGTLYYMREDVQRLFEGKNQ